MPRHNREGLNTSFFHVMCQGINKECIFDDDMFKRKYLEIIKKYIKNSNIDVICYCIMSNHVHILVHAEKIESLSTYMKYVNTEFAKYYNYKNDRVRICI